MTSSASDVAGRDIALLGCGKMGGAMLEGWIAAGADPARVRVIDPKLSDEMGERLASWGVVWSETAEPGPSSAPDALVIAVKPQMMETALPAAASWVGGGTLVFSIAAGTPIAQFEHVFGAERAVVRAMPNTPAAIGQGISGLVANGRASEAEKALAQALAEAVGESLWLEKEEDLDALTAVSGSGPAYVFHVIEALAAAGEAEGLPADLSMRLARATVCGAGALAAASDKPASQLRIDVTSPGGTTAAGLEALMDETDGLGPLMKRTVAAAAARSRALKG